MSIPNLVLPVFAVILTGWLAGAVGYLPRSLAGHLVQFAYNVAMPALVFLTIAQSPARDLFDWRFLAAFGGGSLVCFAVVSAAAWRVGQRGIGASALVGAAASMTNTGFVALPVLQALYGQAGVLPAAIATVFVAVAMFPPVIILLELDGTRRQGRIGGVALLKLVLINPIMLSTLSGLAWSLSRLPLPSAIAAYTDIFGKALTPCALFAIGLGLSLDDLRSIFGTSALLTALKLVVMPALVYGLCAMLGLKPFATLAAVVCAAVPTAKTAYMLAGEYRVEEAVVASTISMSTLFSVATLLAWLYALS
jgi:predicted permease